MIWVPNDLVVVIYITCDSRKNQDRNDRMDFRSVTVKMNWLKETCRCVCPAALAAFVDMGWSGTHCHKQLWSKSSTPLRKAWSILVNLVRIGRRFQITLARNGYEVMGDSLVSVVCDPK